MNEFDSLEGWLGHKARSGGGGKFLGGKWKEKGHCDTWLHTQRLPLVIWRHQFPMYVITEDRDTKEKTKHVYGKTFVCHEDESVLSHPWRDKDTGEREKPPQRCGLCKWIEWLWQECQAWVDSHDWDADEKVWKPKKKARGIDPATVLFKFISEYDEKENKILTAGGICGYFNQKDLDPEVKSAAKKAKIRLDEVFKQVSVVKPESVMCVVNNDDIAAGCQISVEAYALGEAVKAKISSVWKEHEINIQKHPYLIKWEYHPDEQFSKKYSASAMMKVKPSPRVLKLIKGEPPDLAQLKEPYNQQSMRMVLEKHCLLKETPWDDFFPTKEQEKKWAKEDEEAEEKDREAAEEEETEEETEADEAESDEEDEKPVKKKSSKKKDEEEEDDEETVACDECGKPMKLSATKCLACGHSYEVESDEEEDEKPKVKTRSEAKKAAAAKSKKKDEDEEEDDEEEEETEEEDEEEEEKPAKKAAKSKSKSDDEDDTQGDDLPF